jgi:DNA-binding Lrp family transcriptional regulator
MATTPTTAAPDQPRDGRTTSRAIGFVLITTEAGVEEQVYRQLLKVPEIAELMPLFGEFDMIAKIEATDGEALAKTVQERIRSLAGILDTKTLAASRP